MYLHAHLRRYLIGIVALALLLSTVATSQASANTTQTAVFEFTGHPQVFYVPQGVGEVEVAAWGASSGGGSGGYTKAIVPVTPFEPLFVYVGGQPGSNGEGGWNGGGDGGGDSCFSGLIPCITLGSGPGGAGASDVRQGGILTRDDGGFPDLSPIDHRVIVAGGAGSSGHGGGPSGITAPSPTWSPWACNYPGGGGAGGTSGSTWAQGGFGSYNSCGGVTSTGATGGSGSAWQGGHGGFGSARSNPYGFSHYAYGGGGGGGGYGAGGGGGGDMWGGSGGGGGGAGYVAPAADLVDSQTGVNTGPGRVVITWIGPAATPVPEVLPDDDPPVGGRCSNPATHVETVSGTNGGYSYEVKVHDTPTDVEVCATLTGPQGPVFDDDVVVPKDTDPGDYLPPYNPPQVDEDAPSGDGPGTPCTVQHAENGTSSARGYVRSSDTGADDTVICVGFRGGGAERHIRVTVD